MTRPKRLYVSDQMPGIRRRRRGRGFECRLNGRKVSAGERKRIAALAISPAWTDVWICPDPNGHLQATGRDTMGRKQYRYHQQWPAERDQDKYDRLLLFGRCLPDLRKSVEATLVPDADLTRDVVLALVIHLLGETLIRIGNVEYAETNGSFGITTLGDEHLVIGARKVRFSFVGIVTEALATSDLADVDADILAAIDTAAEKLHNTRAVCRTSYVHPAVVEAARKGRLRDCWMESRSQRHLRRGEVTLLEVLEETSG